MTSVKPTYGGDRAHSSGERIILTSSSPKDWDPRRLRRGGEHPGTAIEWAEEYFEVVEAEASHGEYRYTLEPWNDRHTIRRFCSYDAATERQRRIAYQRTIRNRRRRWLLLVAAPLTGLLPARLQSRIESELGLLATTQTTISTVVFLALGIVACVNLVLRITGLLRHGPPLLLLLFGVVMMIDSFYRLARVLGGNVSGCFLLAVPYAFYAAVRYPPEKLSSVGFTPSDDVRLRDRYTLLEPVAALLTPDEQVRLSECFGFDAITWGRKTAWTILVVTFVGACTSFMTLSGARHGKFGAFLSAIVALALGLEQILRLDTLRRAQKSGSVLGFFVRPLFRDLLNAQPSEGASNESTRNEKGGREGPPFSNF